MSNEDTNVSWTAEEGSSNDSVWNQFAIYLGVGFIILSFICCGMVVFGISPESVNIHSCKRFFTDCFKNPGCCEWTKCCVNCCGKSSNVSENDTKLNEDSEDESSRLNPPVFLNPSPPAQNTKEDEVQTESV